MRLRRGHWLLLLALLAAWQLGQAGYIHAKALLAQHLLQTAWQRTLAGETKVRPWPWADTWPVARLQVPRLGVDLIVLDGASGSSLAFGPGHLHGSALPGAAGNSIISGHRDTHFAFLRQLQPGDTIQLQVMTGQQRLFRMTQKQVFDARSHRLAAGDEAARLILLTCYPFDALVPGGPLRYLVELELVSHTG